MIIAEGTSRVEVRPDGELGAVAPRTGGTPLITALPTKISTGDHREGFRREVTVDVDEVLITEMLDGLRIEVRHSFSVGWTTRVAVINSGDRPVEISVELAIEPSPYVTVWRVCTGSTGTAVLLGATGPLLMVRTVTGTLDEVTAAGLRFGPTTVAVRERRTSTVRWDWLEAPVTLRQALPAGLPLRATAWLEEVIEVPSDPDTALVLPEGAWAADELEQGQLITGVGLQQLQLRSARGTTRVELAWAEPEDAVLSRAIRRFRSGARTSAGVLKIDDVSVALALQAQVRSGSADADELSDALDRFTVRLLDDEPDDPREPSSLCCCYLAGEVHRLVDGAVLEVDELLDRIAAELAAVVRTARRRRRVPTGLGLAVVRLTLAELLRGRPASAVATVAALLDDVPADPGSAAAWWEACFAGGRLLGERRRPDDLLRGLGRRLGAGLPGTIARPWPAAEQAHVITVLRMVPDDAALALAADWGVTPAEVVEQASAALALRLESAELGAAHGWLALMQPV